MAPAIDIEALTALVRESGVEFITHSKAIRKAWEDIAEKYCEDKGIEPVNYKVFSVRWKNQKFYSKKKAKMRELGLTHKDFVKIKTEMGKSTGNNSTSQPSNVQSSMTPSKASDGPRPTTRTETDFEKEERCLRMEEIRQRMKFNEELFVLQREKLQLEVARAKLFLQQRDQQRQIVEEESHTTFIIE